MLTQAIVISNQIQITQEKSMKSIKSPPQPLTSKLMVKIPFLVIKEL